FNDIANEKTSVPSIVHNGWLGISQHYFASVFLLNPVGHSSICKPSPCQLYVDNNRADRLYQVGFTVMLPIIGAGQS
ncbi:YidC/Oxa1 family insertase periplasmic-domain containing protein, partial [Loigolactobacillus coryniformis]|uniref:YidC/Oxa1 family insertase periplasmic-domain containing protein n=1 Tax=Loigolactobacillus coryniformis TaxID=1610 RepID=UPI00201A4636